MLKIFPVKTDEDLMGIQAIRMEYIDFLKDRFAGYYCKWWFASMLMKHKQVVLDLPGPCCAPSGCLLLATIEDRVVGCVALESFENNISKMEGLYVRPGSRKLGVGGRLVEAVIKQAIGIGYNHMRLITYQELHEAGPLYRSIGFNEISPFAVDITKTAIFLELKLK